MRVVIDLSTLLGSESDLRSCSHMHACLSKLSMIQTVILSKTFGQAMQSMPRASIHAANTALPTAILGTRTAAHAVSKDAYDCRPYRSACACVTTTPNHARESESERKFKTLSAVLISAKSVLASADAVRLGSDSWPALTSAFQTDTALELCRPVIQGCGS